MQASRTVARTLSSLGWRVALCFAVAVAVLSSSSLGGAVLVIAPPGPILDMSDMSFNGSLLREWLLHHAAVHPRCVDQVMAVLEVEEVFSLDDLRRLAGHPHFDSCGLSVLSVLKIRDALASQQSQPPQPTQLQQPQQSPQLPQSPPFAVAETRDALPSQQPRHETQAEMQAAAEDFAIDLLKLSPQARVLRFCNRLRADPETAMKEHLKELRSAAIAQAQAASQPHADAIETVRADQALRDAGKYYRLAIAHEIVPTPISESSRRSSEIMPTPISESSRSASYLTLFQLQTAPSCLRVEGAAPPTEVTSMVPPVSPRITSMAPSVSPRTEALRRTDLPGARARALHYDDTPFRSTRASSVDGGVGGLHDLFASCDPLFHPGMDDDRPSSASSVSSFNAAEPYPPPCSVSPAPLPRGLAWLRSAWRDIIQDRTVRGPRRHGETDYDLLSRLGFWHDDHFGDDGFGWVDAVDAGYSPGYLGGRVFQPMSPSVLDAAWTCAAWRRALHGVQTHLMGARGQAWLALRKAERAQREAFRGVCHERSLSARARPCIRHDRAGHLQRLEDTYLRAVRCAGEHRMKLRQRAGAVCSTSRPGIRRTVRVVSAEAAEDSRSFGRGRGKGSGGGEGRGGKGSGGKGLSKGRGGKGRRGNGRVKGCAIGLP